MQRKTVFRLPLAFLRKPLPALLCSISCHSGFNFPRPRLYAARQVVQLLKAHVFQEAGNVKAAQAVMAIDDNRHAVGQFVLPQGNQVHRNVCAVGDLADLRFALFAHVQQKRVGALLQQGLRLLRGELSNHR